jgi:hypothetical protein
MPKYGIHYIVLDEMAKKLATSSSSSEKAIANSIRNNRAAANLGAIGPDLLFWAPDFDFVQGLRNFIEPFKSLKKVIGEIEDIVKGISEGFENVKNMPKDFVLGQLQNSPIPIVRDTARSVTNLDDFMQKAKDNLANNFDAVKSEILPAICLKGLGMDAGLETFTLARSVFQGQFGSGNQIGKEEQDWYWFDMLHYRKTGDFAKKLIENAEASNNEELKAYAYAYVTHYVTDTVGHPFVNTISGSPFRIAAQRHAVIENYMDQYEWNNRYDNNIRNEMYKSFQFDSYTISDKLAELISTTLKDTYGTLNSARPHRYKNNDGFLSKDDIKVAFELQKLALEFLGGSEAILKPVEPKPGFDEILSAFFDDIDFPSPPTIPTNSNPNETLPNLTNQIEEWLQSIENWVKWAVEVAKELADTIVDAIVTASNTILEAVTFTIELLTYAIQCLMYNIYRAIHQILVLSGIAYPEPDDVDLNNPLAKDHITTHKAAIHEKYPILKFPGQQHLDRKSYLDILKTNVSPRDYNFTNGQNSNPLQFKDNEAPFTKNSFYPRNASTTPKIFIDDSTNTPLDIAIFKRFADAQTPEDTRALYGLLNRGFGNAVDLSIYILTNKNNTAHDVFCNWNLDGDRGYGYKTWDGIPFTCTNSENKGLIRASKVRGVPNNFSIYAELDEYAIQNSQTWTKMTLDNNGTTKIENEVYVKDKLKSQGFLSPITVSEKNIPEEFTDPQFYMDTNRVTAAQWAALLPDRYTLLSSKINSDNFFFVNGIDTTPCAGQRATLAIEKTLNRACKQELKLSKKKIKINYFHNYSDLIWGDLSTIADVIEVIFSDYFYIFNLYDKIHNNKLSELLKIKITNPAQVAVMALLHKGMLENKRLMISGHSQGSMITSSAILAFSTISDRHKAYLKKSVKVFHMEPEVLKSIRKMIRELLNEDLKENKKHLVYIMNNSDSPLGSDTLTDFFAQDFPLGPIVTLNIESEINTIKAAFSNMQQNINAENILRIGDVIASGSAQLKAVFDRFINSDFRYQMDFTMDNVLDSHQISNQLRIIEADIIKTKFRSDPIDDAIGILSRISNSPYHESAVNVKNFILT